MTGDGTAEDASQQSGQQPRHRQILTTVRVPVGPGIGPAVQQPPYDDAGEEEKKQHNADQPRLRLPRVD
jgi:hypothetical protein